MEPLTWNPGMETPFPVEAAHETFTSPPGGTLLGLGEKSPADPFMVQPVAPAAVPPEFTSDITHSPVFEVHTTLLTVTCAGGPTGICELVELEDWLVPVLLDTTPGVGERRRRYAPPAPARRITIKAARSGPFIPPCAVDSRVR